MGSSDYNYLAYNSSKEEPARYEGFFRLYQDNNVWKVSAPSSLFSESESADATYRRQVKFAQNYGVPTQSSVMIKVEMDPVISASPSSETV